MKRLLTPIILPLVATVITFCFLFLLLFLTLHGLNLFPIKQKIVIALFPLDILVGLTIYLKTSVDFALFIGNLMHTYPGWRNRIAIEVGTAAGNALGTLLILTLWTFFKEIPLLLLMMVLLASLVLFQMAEESFEEYLENHTYPQTFSRMLNYFYTTLRKINPVFTPLLRYIIPHASIKTGEKGPWLRLLLFALTIPFVLGLDDFAGYVPLFSVINVFGFATGVFLGHMLLNSFLFAKPSYTTRIVRLPFIQVLGGFTFIGLGLWGFVEAIHILSTLIHI